MPEPSFESPKSESDQEKSAEEREEAREGEVRSEEKDLKPDEFEASLDSLKDLEKVKQFLRGSLAEGIEGVSEFMEALTGLRDAGDGVNMADNTWALNFDYYGPGDYSKKDFDRLSFQVHEALYDAVDAIKEVMRLMEEMEEPPAPTSESPTEDKE